LPSDRESLQQSHDNQKDNRPTPYSLVSWQCPHDEGRKGHEKYTEHQRFLAAILVADITEHRAADGTHTKSESKDEIGILRAFLFRLGGRKEDFTEDVAEVAKDGEIVPFQHVAGHAGDGLPAIEGWVRRWRHIPTVCSFLDESRKMGPMLQTIVKKKPRFSRNGTSCHPNVSPFWFPVRHFNKQMYTDTTNSTKSCNGTKRITNTGISTSYGSERAHSGIRGPIFLAFH
jgi:hypothetical protein